jgi:DNA-binding GntR family transcriptional regulator
MEEQDSAGPPATDPATGDGGRLLPARASAPGPSRPLSRQVQVELEALITEGVLRPGERLNEVALARRLGVSRGPVREAARALERSGLLTVIANRGAFVRALTLDEAMEIYELNAVIFGLAAGQVATCVTAEVALELRALVESINRAIAQGDRDAFFEFNVRFHQRIMVFARNRQAEAVYLDYTKKLLLFRRRSFDRIGNMAESNAEHHQLLDAILAGMAALARERAEAHARSGRARFLSAIDCQEAEPPATICLPRDG